MLRFVPLLLILLPACLGTSLQGIYLSPPPSLMSPPSPSLEHATTALNRASFTPFITAPRHHFKFISPLLAQSPESEGPVTRPPYSALTPDTSQDCSQDCAAPLTPAPFGSPCMCVVPMRVRLLMWASIYVIFEEATEFEIEVATGTYLMQCQVRLTGATADEQNPEQAVVDLNLVPLGEKFDSTTALLIYHRFFNKKVVLNRTIFGNYDLIYIKYPGLTSSPSPKSSPGRAGNDPFPVDPRNNYKRTNTQLIIIVSFSIVAFLVVCLAAAAVILKCMYMNRPSDTVGPEFSSLNQRSGSVRSITTASVTSPFIKYAMPPSILSMRTFSLAELKTATENFSSKMILGEGGFGCVYHGTLQDGSEVAVKLVTRNDQSGAREFIAEIEMLSRLHHRNLVKLIGMCIEGHMRCLVYELVVNGSVESHLHGADRSKGYLNWDARLKIALGAARGLAYLHEESNPCVIHRDFKGSNVLLENDFTPKISDFGLAREAAEGNEHVSTQVMGTFGYVAPEYAMTGHLLVKSDVYSYGVVLLELLSGRKPVDMSRPPGHENLVTWARPLLTNREGLEQLVDPTLIRTINFDDLAKVAAIASICVHSEVAHRPFMGEVVQALKLIYNDTDETSKDAGSRQESSVDELDSKGDFARSDNSWWNAGDVTPTRQISPLLTMEYCSHSHKGINNRTLSLGRMSCDPELAKATGSTREHVVCGRLLKYAWYNGKYQSGSF